MRRDNARQGMQQFWGGMNRQMQNLRTPQPGANTTGSYMPPRMANNNMQQRMQNYQNSLRRY